MGRWIAFPAKDRFTYDSKSVRKLWARLHAGDREPLPESSELLQAWAQFHNGHFEAAHFAALRLGGAGMTLANRAACVYASQLETRAAERQTLYGDAVERAQSQVESDPANPNSHFQLACALNRYSQSISVARALAQGLGGRIMSALETTIALQPLHADAHFALGAFHADIIDKVGALIAQMAYGARRDNSLEMFAQGFALQPHSPAGLVDYALALLALDGDVRQEEAAALYARAAALEPLDASEYLDIAQAKRGLPV